MNVQPTLNSIAIFTNAKWLTWLGNKFDLKMFNKVIITDEITDKIRAQYYNLDTIENYDYSARYGISLHFQRIFSEEQIKRFKLLLNVHPGLIPQSRGTYPVFWNVLGFEPIGVTVHEITKKIDFGRYLFRVPLHYEEHSSMTEIAPKVVKLEKKLFVDCINAICNKNLVLIDLDNTEIGPNRKLSEFIELRDKGRPNLSASEKRRYKLAFNHSDFPIPKWLSE